MEFYNSIFAVAFGAYEMKGTIKLINFKKTCDVSFGLVSKL